MSVSTNYILAPHIRRSADGKYSREDRREMDLMIRKAKKKAEKRKKWQREQ